MKKKKIAVITTTRAEYGLLYWLIRGLDQDSDCELQLIVSGTHLLDEFGNTIDEIKKNNLQISEKVEMFFQENSKYSVAKSIGRGVIGFADAFEKLKPDMIVILGDRFELLSISSVAVAMGIPIAHIHGGELTEGSFDEQIRHAITKMAHLHFVTTDFYSRIVKQMGERDDRVFNFGAPGLENITRLSLLSKTELETSLNFKLRSPTILLTFHPETNSDLEPENQIKEVLAAIEATDCNVIFTYANADPGGRIINTVIEKFTKNSNKYLIIPSLGQKRYLSMLQYVDCVIGNSSSGIIEVPSFKIPTVNIGDRQKGRIRAPSIIDCKLKTASINLAINKALTVEFQKECCLGISPYENGQFSLKSLKVIKEFIATGSSCRKKFCIRN